MRYLGLGLGLGLVALAALASSWTLIQPGHKGVVRRFGRVLADQPGPGLHFFLPFGMDRVAVVKLEEPRQVTVGQLGSDAEAEDGVTPAGQFLTGDQNLINVRVTLTYKVTDRHVEKYVLNADRVDGVLQRLTENAVAAWVGGRTIEEVMLVGRQKLPAWLADELRRGLPAYDMGIDISQLPSVDPSVPPEVKPAFDAVNQAETEIETQANRAGEQAQKRVSQAKEEKYMKEADAAIYQTQKREQTLAEVFIFEQELAKSAANPHYRTVRWWNALSRIYAQLRGRVEPLEHYLTPDGLNITTVPQPPKK